MRFEYFSKHTTVNGRFLRLPKILFTNEAFAELSAEAKLLYGLMLDRVGLSVNNNWLDELGRVYIYYTLDQIRCDFSCSYDKAIKLVNELDSIKGIGLIERTKQGLGQPARILVKNIVDSPETT